MLQFMGSQRVGHDCSIELKRSTTIKKVKMKSLSCVLLFATPWTVAYHAPPSMGFSRQECWSGVPLPSPNDQLDHSNWKSGASHSEVSL